MKRKSMEGDKGKRKVGDEVINGGEEDEEEKMNAFYALVKNIRDVHHQKMLSKQGLKAPIWTPSFTWEDFAGDAQLRNKFFAVPPPSSSSSSSKDEEKLTETKKAEAFDLNLSL